VRGDKDMGVREACARSLGSLGPAAKPAIPHLMHLLTPPPVNPNATPAEIRAEAEWEDFRRVVRDAVKQIQGR